MKKWSFVRKAVQIAALGVLALPLVFTKPIWFGTYLSAQFLTIALTDPLAALEVTLAGKELWLPLLWSVLPLVVVALLLGRVFCGWICPLNTLLELVALIKPSQVNSAGSSYFSYVLLAGCLLLSLFFSLPVFTMISPIGILSRLFVFGAGFEVLLIVIIVFAEWFIGQKTWCRNFCPAGALYGVLGRGRVIGVALDRTKCTHCGHCQTTCTMNVHIASDALLDVLNCTNCGACIDVCTEKALHFSLKKQKGGQKHCESVESIER